MGITKIREIRERLTASKLKDKNILLIQLRHIIASYRAGDAVEEEFLLFVEMVEIDFTLHENNFHDY